MVRVRQWQRPLWDVEALVLPDADKLWPEALRRIDALLEDEAVLEPFAHALARRWPQSRGRGRRGTPVEVGLRMLVLKHLYDWSYDVLEREVRANLVYRAFSRVGGDPVPDAKTVLKIAHALGPETIQALHQRVVALARARRVVRGRRLRIDTTVVETNIHYPTDSALLADGVRVLLRTMTRIRGVIGAGRHHVRNRLRAVTRRCWAIGRLARRAATKRPLIRAQYRALLATTRAVMRDAARTLRRLRQCRRRLAAPVQRGVAALAARTRAMLGLLERVRAQARQRVFRGNTRVPDKVLSVFEPHTEVIRKGKLRRPTEFGKVVTIQEAEGQIVTAYTVHAHRPDEQQLWVPALERHEALFGRPPWLAAADRGFASAANERAAYRRGVRRVVLPQRGRPGPRRRAHERQRWFRQGQRWRVGGEGRISVLKRRHGLARCPYHGPEGMERWVGLGVIASNLMAIATA